MSSHKSSLWPAVFAVAGLAALVLFAYGPLLRAGFIWDDQWIVENFFVRHWSGFWYIWRGAGGVTDEYYPLAYSVFLLEHMLWGVNPLDYHLFSIVLQAINGLLLWRILKRLGLKSAWLIAAIFAIHPVQVETVAWVAEQKTLLSALCYFVAVLAWLRFAKLGGAPDDNPAVGLESRARAPHYQVAARKPSRDSPQACSPPAKRALLWRDLAWYFLALLFFVLALLAKTAACTLPAILLLLLWWKRGRLTWRDILVYVPWFLAAWWMARMTVGVETGGSPAMGGALQFTLGQRLLIAGKDLWFYPLKLFWPWPLLEIYPRWSVAALGGVEWLFPLTAAAVPVALFLLRGKIGRGPFTAAAFYGLTIAPVLGFISWGYLLRSFVADHLQYMACIGLIALTIEGFWFLVSSGRLGGRGPQAEPETTNHKPEALLGTGVSGILLAVLGVFTWAQSWVYFPPVHVWTHVLKYYPDCAVALENMARDGHDPAQVARGIALLRRTFQRTHGANALLDADLGGVYFAAGDYAAAQACYQRTLRADPRYLHAAVAIIACDQHLGGGPRLLTDLRREIKAFPASADLQLQLANTLEAQRRYGAALPHFRAAIRGRPYDPEALYALALDLEMLGQRQEALHYYCRAVHFGPHWPMARFAYGRCLMENGHPAAAARQFRRTLTLLAATSTARRAVVSRALVKALAALRRPSPR